MVWHRLSTDAVIQKVRNRMRYSKHTLYFFKNLATHSLEEEVHDAFESD